ncbi:hypothetical protein OCU04_011997 [Sclerotinia nivalis]|uniref:Uncharacterized protein n=1 Tax=Sclerotinia nivalis TaxID=352851 RepID=A0A9X0AA75_9HELO|nr:hypothetical protein OCU04_011997 [Sclerotinia nivalis]
MEPVIESVEEAEEVIIDEEMEDEEPDTADLVMEANDTEESDETDETDGIDTVDELKVAWELAKDDFDVELLMTVEAVLVLLGGATVVEEEVGIVDVDALEVVVGGGA